MRARAVYLIGFAFIFTQIVNQGILTLLYKGFSIYHIISLASIISVSIVVYCLRYSKKFTYFALAYMVLIIAGISSTAVADGTGINSTLLPTLIAGTIMAGFVSNWKMVLAYCGFAISFVWFLYYVTITADPTPIFINGVEQSHSQRAVQATLAIVLITSMVSLFSYNMYRLFDLLEDSLEKAHDLGEAKSQFLANMSHELRTPLNGVIGMTGLLLKTDLNSQQKQYVEIVNGCSKSLVTIINDVLDLSKLDAGKVVIQSQSFDMHHMLNSLGTLHFPAAQKKDLQILYDWDSEIPTHLIGDESRLRQVTNNLIGNAIKFTDSGLINIATRLNSKTEDSCEFTVYIRDTGTGISRDEMKRVFKRFEQLDSSLTKQAEGTGLGLSVSKELIHAMGGEIYVASEVGVGSTFFYTIKLPIADAYRESLQPHRSKAA